MTFKIFQFENDNFTSEYSLKAPTVSNAICLLEDLVKTRMSEGFDLRDPNVEITVNMGNRIQSGKTIFVQGWGRAIHWERQDTWKARVFNFTLIQID